MEWYASYKLSPEEDTLILGVFSLAADDVFVFFLVFRVDFVLDVLLDLRLDMRLLADDAVLLRELVDTLLFRFFVFFSKFCSVNDGIILYCQKNYISLTINI